METFQDSIEFNFRDGFFPSQTEFGDLYPDTAKEAENVWFRAGEWISDRGALNAASVALPCNPLQNVGGVAGGMTGGTGNVTQHAGVDWFAGVGVAVKGNQVLGASADKLMVVINGTAVEAGLDPPGAPILDTNGGAASGQITGSYAIAAVALRSTSGGKGNRSPMSNAVALKNKKLRISSWGSIPTGTTHILLYGTRKGHGAVGPTYRILSIAPIPVASLVPGLELEYQDGDLGELAPFTNDKPPACTHCIGLGGHICAVGTFGGYGISPSKINEPEAFDVGQTSFLASREAVTALTARGSDGAAFVGTRNSVSLIILTGNPQVPVLPRGVFENTGVAHAGAMTWFYDTLYVFSSTGSLCRSQGSEEPDLSFGLPVQNEFMRRDFTAENTFVVGDERNGAIIVASGNRAYPFMLASGRWSGAIILPGIVTGKVELDGAAHLQIGNGLYQLDAANAGGNWFLRSPYLGGRPGFRHHLKTLREFWGASKNALTMDLLVDESGASIGGKFPYAFTQSHGRVQKSRRRFRSIALKVSGNTGSQQFHSAQIDYTVNAARK